MRFIYLVVFASVFLSNANSQEKKLTIDDCYHRIYKELRPERLKNTEWNPDNERFSFSRKDTFYMYNLDSHKEEKIFTLQEMNQAFEPYLEGVTLQSVPAYKWIKANTIAITGNNKQKFYAEFNISNKKLSKYIALDDKAAEISLSPSNSKIAYVADDNIFIRDEDGKVLKITEDGGEGIVNGKAVHRFEFGISKGLFWSPDGRYLAYYRMDESMVDDYPLVDISKPIAEVNTIKYPMAGRKSHHVSVWCYDTKKDEKVKLQTGEPLEQYLTNVTWTPDEKSILIAVVNRPQKIMEVELYSARTGEKEKTVFMEQNNKYVEPLFKAQFLPWDKDKFLWISRRDGYHHFYLYDLDKGLEKQITQGDWEVIDFSGFHESGKAFYFKAKKDSPLQEKLYVSYVEEDSIKTITTGRGVHRAQISNNGQWILDEYSNLETPRKMVLINTTSGSEKLILSSGNPLKDYALGEIEMSTIKAADNETDLYYRLNYPINFDSTKKYPVMIYVYNGPHVQLNKDKWYGSRELWQQYLAQNGIISLTLDGRGSSGRGMEFESATYRQLGQVEMKDQLKGVDFLKSKSFVDADRIGVFGWSYGGYMTLSLSVNHPNIFKTAVAGGPVTNWEFYEVMYTERYMDTPEYNPEGYKQTNVNTQVDKLENDLLVIHGAQDPTVVWQHSLRFVRECIKNEVLIDYFVYPTHEHNVRGKDRVHLFEKITDFIQDTL